MTKITKLLKAPFSPEGVSGLKRTLAAAAIAAGIAAGPGCETRVEYSRKYYSSPPPVYVPPTMVEEVPTVVVEPSPPPPVYVPPTMVEEVPTVVVEPSPPPPVYVPPVVEEVRVVEEVPVATGCFYYGNTSGQLIVSTDSNYCIVNRGWYVCEPAEVRVFVGAPLVVGVVYDCYRSPGNWHFVEHGRNYHPPLGWERCAPRHHDGPPVRYGPPGNFHRDERPAPGPRHEGHDDRDGHRPPPQREQGNRHDSRKDDRPNRDNDDRSSRHYGERREGPSGPDGRPDRNGDRPNRDNRRRGPDGPGHR